MMDNRAVSEVLSYILVFTLIVSSVAVVSVSGLDTLEDAKNAQQIGNAERAFDIIADNMADIYQRGARSRATEVDVRESQIAVGNRTDINVTVDGNRVVNVSARRIILTGEQDRRLVYAGGAVFRENRDSAITLRNPPFIVRDDKVLVHVINTASLGLQSLGGSTVLLRAKQTDRRIRYNDTTGSSSVSVQIRSPRFQQWNQTLSEQGFDCVDAGAEAVQCDYTGSFNRVYVVTHRIEVELEP